MYEWRFVIPSSIRQSLFCMHYSPALRQESKNKQMRIEMVMSAARIPDTYRWYQNISIIINFLIFQKGHKFKTLKNYWVELSVSWFMKLCLSVQMSNNNFLELKKKQLPPKKRSQGFFQKLLHSCMILWKTTTSFIFNFWYNSIIGWYWATKRD